MQNKNIWNHLTYASLTILAIGTFTSVSLSAVSHILIIPPAIYFFVKRYKVQSISNSSWALLAFTLSIVLSVFVNWNQIETPVRNLSKAKYFIICFLSIYSYHSLFIDVSTKKIRALINLFILATTLASLSGLIALKWGFNPLKFGKPPCHPRRACGVYGMYMTYGYGISFFMSLLTGLILYRDKLKEYLVMPLVYVAFVVNFLGLYLSLARGAWIGYAVSLPFLFWHKGKKVVVGIILGVVITSALIFAVSPKVRHTFLNRAGSNSQRISFFKAAFYAFKENPVFGVGYRNFESKSKEIKIRHSLSDINFAGHAHNNYLEHLASSGLLAFLSTLLFFFFWAKEVMGIKSVLSGIVLAQIVNLFTSGMFQYTLGDGENLFFILSFYALTQVYFSKQQTA